MRRLLLLMAVAALASCSDIANDVDGGVTTPSDDATQVSFTASISSETRVTGDPEIFENGDAIMVSAFTDSSYGNGDYNPFEAFETGVNKSYTYTDGSFTSDDPITREDAFQELTYLAVYPGGSFSTLYDTFEFTVESDQSVEGNLELSDLLIATVFGSTETTPALEFNHALSCLTITFEGKNGEDLVGLYGLDETTLTVTAKATTYVSIYNNGLDYDATIPEAEDLTAAYIGENSFKVFFAPQTIKEGAYLATITFGNKTFTWEAKNDITFESGERYNYTWKIDTEDMDITGTTYDVTFSSNGATYDTQMVAENGTATAPETDPTTADATFIGWYTDAELTEIYDFSTAVTEDITLTAKYWDHTATEVSLYNLEEFLTFRDLTNLGIALDATITLKTSIDLSTECGAELGDWTPIANSTAATGDNVFTGTFDGGDHTISNLYSVSATGHNRSLFSLVKDATIKNVHMVNVYIVNSGTSNYNSAIAGYVPTAGTVYLTNCSTTGGSISGSNQCGGIFGAAGVGTVVIDNCHNYGTSVATSGNFAGGIVSRTYTTGSNAVNSKITNCSNSGTITGGSGYGGGIVGELSCSAQIIGCFNTGTISKNAIYQGGIAGITQYWTTNDDVSIIACYNLGTISATTVSNVGGVLGGVYTKTGSKVSITSCYNMGSISTSGTSGGILGNSNGTATLTDNYYIGNPTYGKGGATADVAGATKVTDLAGLNSVLSIMNASCEDSGYEFVEGDDNPTLQEITTTSDNTDNDSVDAD